MCSDAGIREASSVAHKELRIERRVENLLTGWQRDHHAEHSPMGTTRNTQTTCSVTEPHRMGTDCGVEQRITVI
jgi:hypothetical protein